MFSVASVGVLTAFDWAVNAIIPCAVQGQAAPQLRPISLLGWPQFALRVDWDGAFIETGERVTSGRLIRIIVAKGLCPSHPSRQYRQGFMARK